jgi:LPS sulfotransferase NodH
MRVCADLGMTMLEVASKHRNNPTLIIDALRMRAQSMQKLFGCKIFYTHVPGVNLLRSGYFRNAVILHLYREKVLDAFTSLKLARATGKWMFESYGDVRLDFDVDEYMIFRTSLRSAFADWRTWLATNHPPGRLMEIAYSRIGTEQLLDDVGAMLGIGGLVPPLVFKQARKPAEEYWRKGLAHDFAADELF